MGVFATLGIRLQCGGEYANLLLSPPAHLCCSFTATATRLYSLSPYLCFHLAITCVFYSIGEIWNNACRSARVVVVRRVAVRVHIEEVVCVRSVGGVLPPIRVLIRTAVEGVPKPASLEHFMDIFAQISVLTNL